MKQSIRLAASLVLTGAVVSGTAFAADITGAGATFPYPLYAKWAEAYKAASNNSMNYQSIGSGGGIKQIQSKTVDFGASDMPLKPEELAKSDLTQFPTVIGGVVPVYNLPGVAAGQVKFTGALLAEIFMGKVSKWNDPAIASLNPGVKLPDQKITVVRRSDGSGTTFIFTNYLSKVSSDWAGKVGSNTAVNWPTGVGGKGNEGVANYVTRIKGAIGYVEYAYAKQNKLSYGQLQNQAGAYVAPSEESFKASAGNADWKNAPGFYLILTNQPGKTSWPISGATFILMHKKQDKPVQGSEALKFFDWAYKNGDKTALDLDYIPMPANVKATIRDSWKQITDNSGKAIWK
ncbi:phosphate ABC transporter, periplasmic phosphate-binding protein PstS [Pseudogulbenkiania sp. NH8B]|uniref:Phosphate-binding protein PstS n=1 Tax=Pseudogulbenkiania ferrooxidans 2002 TaxID=279714 RepID=B9Z249_9NEIS|nr:MULTISPECIES: phosphate ABC transporter substrate-binding protein PstS [Pseudogulbenkiania]EEG09494.1 phosphate ABC transporter, periplasmic phosphate-binding protein [Pseudogulbenkiania ferrooxidans 2002]BAK75446.1 phosphate ABC transporter, periplasmic phosphate-binding protein PstS [Pseudogulbenkiania sp. NH8B]